MKKHNVVLFSLLTSTTLFGQEVISSQGETFSNASGTIDFTLGETVISTVSTANNDVTQGFHQTNWNYAGVDDLQPDYEATVFPNPMESELQIKAKHFEGVHFQFIDASGKLIQEGPLKGEVTTIEVAQVATGAYQLLLLDEQDQPLKNFKLIKTQEH